MLRDYLKGSAWFAGEGWNGVSKVSVGIARRP
jgi:hypothetical protein